MSNPLASGTVRLWPVGAVLVLSIVLVGCGRGQERVPAVEADKPTSVAAGEPDPVFTFDGPSDKLEKTVVVPTLDTPMPEGQSAIWCSSFQIAWNHLKDLAKDPPAIAGVEDVINKLNGAPQSEADLAAETYFAAAGWTKHGIVERIKQEMGKRFPRVQLPEFLNEPAVGVMFAYVSAREKYTHEYHEDVLRFQDSLWNPTEIKAFGVRSQDEGAGRQTYREQIHVLYGPKSGSPYEARPQEFALDLCRHSAPNQLILAAIPRRESLAAILRDLNEKTSAYKEPYYQRFQLDDTLLVPEMSWRLIHRFRELENKPFQNNSLAGLYLSNAMQIIQFKLDRRGAELDSIAGGTLLNGPRHFHFDRPFLIIMKKRDAKHPFFVMWVDNAELLCKK